jgi:hypothetical protein
VGGKLTRSACLVTAVALAACGGSKSTKPPSESAKPTPLAIEIVKEGKSFRMDAPSSVKAGPVDITLTVPDEKTPHDAQFVRVDGDHTPEEVARILSEGGKPIPDWLIAAGGVGQTADGATGKTRQQLAPGKYVILDTAEESASAELEVTAEGESGEAPSAAANVTAEEYTFRAQGLKPGKNTILFNNAGRQPHHVEAFPYKEGATLADVKKSLEEDGEGGGPPPVDFDAGDGTAVLEGGTKQVTELDLKAGKYALVCFISDREGGPPHVAKGMIVEATVE